MSEAAQLLQIEERLDILVAEADRIAEDPTPPPNGAWKPLFDKLRAQARAALAKARAPVKIGVVGEFSAGKTLLLGGLIGYADALPVKEIATTGNVTALRFTSVEGLVTTEVGPYRIDFLDHAGFVECLRYMLKEAARRAKSSDLPEDMRDRLGAIKADDEQAPSKVDDWGRAAWGRTTSPALKYSIRELVRFVRAYMRCGTGLCEGGEAFVVDAPTAVRGLELDAVSDNIQTAAFGDIPTPTHNFSSRPATLSSEQLRDAFPLIRLVTVEVKLSRGLWDFSGLGAERFVLMDFPGLGADSSGVRDLYLCLNELKEIQTLLILLNGRKPGGDQGLKIHSLLQEHREGQDISDMVLVGVGRFDQLPLGAEGEAKLRELAGAASKAKKKKRSATEDDDDQDADEAPKPAATGPLTENALVQALPILGSAVAGAEALVPGGRSDRVVFLSPLLHLKLLEEKNVGLSVGSEEFMSTARQDVEQALALRPLWRGVAARLVPSPGGRAKPLLAQWLGDFAEDGGVARLRQLILSHVQGAGFAQLLRDVVREGEAVKQTLRDFRQALPPANGVSAGKTPEDQLVAVERELRHLAEFYQDQAQRLNKTQRLALTKDDLTRPLEEYLHEEVVFQVSDWTHWDTLLHHSENGYIRERVAGTTAKNKGPFGDDDEDDDSEDAPFPTKSEDFFGPFEETVKKLEKSTRELIDQGVTEYLTRLAPEVEAARLALGSLLERKSLPKEIRLTKQGGERAKNLVGRLRTAVNPARLREGLFRTEEAAEDAPPESAADLALSPQPTAILFPLARSTKEVPGRVFGWADKFQQAAEDARPEAHLSHEAMVLRLRDEFVRILRQEMSQQLNVGTQAVLKRLTKYLNDMVQGLTFASSNRIVLDTIMTQQAASPAGPATDPVGVFRRLASVNLT